MFGLDNAKLAHTLMITYVKLSHDLSGKYVEQILYKSIIGSLLYLTPSHPDISFNITVCARFQDYPKESHISAIKRVIKYSSGTY